MTPGPMGRVEDKTMPSSELEQPHDHFPMRQWLELPNPAISSTITFHKFDGSGLRRRLKGHICTLAPFFFAFQRRDMHGRSVPSHFSHFLSSLASERPKNGPTHSQEELDFLASFPIICVSREQLCPSGHPSSPLSAPTLSSSLQ